MPPSPTPTRPRPRSAPVPRRRGAAAWRRADDDDGAPRGERERFVSGIPVRPPRAGGRAEIEKCDASGKPYWVRARNSQLK